MINKDTGKDLGKEALQRALLAGMFFSVNKCQMKGAPTLWSRLMQELFKERRM